MDKLVIQILNFFFVLKYKLLSKNNNVKILQLGMMVIAVGLSSYNIALFHLVNHAFYKGLLFLGAGAVIHAVSDNQDFRKYGGLRPFLPLTYSVMLIASLSLVAFPFMTGFYSKDFILESAYGQFYFSSTVVYFIATIGAMFTTLYSVKVLYLTFLTNPNGPLINYKQAHEGDIFMSLPLIILAVFSIFFGYVTKDIFIGLGSGFFADNSLFIHPKHEIMLDTEFAVPLLFKLLPLAFTISLSAISIVLSEFLPRKLLSFKFSRLGYNIFSFFNQRFYIELLYNKYVTGLILKLGGQTTKVLDKGSVELLGPFGLEKGLLNLSSNLSKLDTGVITSYALYILIGLIFYILTPYLSLTDSSLLLLVIFGLFTLNSETLYSNRDIYPDFKNSSSGLSSQESSLVTLTRDTLIYKLLLGYFLVMFMIVAPSVGGFVSSPNLDGDLHNIIQELDRLFPQLNEFINRFKEFVNETQINVITDAQGVLSIEVLEGLNDSLAQVYANKIQVIDNLIHNHIHKIEELLGTASEIEAKILESDQNYISQLAKYLAKLKELSNSYGHIH